MMLRTRPAFLMTAFFAVIAAPAAFVAACSATGKERCFDCGEGGSGQGGGDGGTIFTGSGGGLNIDGGGGGGQPQGDPTTCEQAAQVRSYIGCDFWPTVVGNNVWSIFDYAVVVANAGDNPADVTVTRNGQTIASAIVQPNALQKIYLPWVPELKGPDADSCGQAVPISQTVRSPNGAYHLTSTRPVTVYQFNALEYAGQGGPAGKNWSSCPGNSICPIFGISYGCFSFTNDASLLLPTTALTGNYRVTGQAGWPVANMGAYFAITGTKNGTTVTVKVSSTGQVVGGGGISSTAANGLTTFQINEGEVVEVVGTPDSDLSGSQIQASAPVQVIAGVPCIQSPLGVQACDHIEESVFPAETLGKHYFVTVPTGPNGDVVGHVVRLYGNVDGTALSYQGNKPPGAPSTLNAGQVVTLGSPYVTGDFEITGDHEFGVGSFMLGAEVVDPNALSEGKGDPAQSLATAVEQYRHKYIFLSPDDYDVSYVDVIQPTGASITIDGMAPGGAVTPISSGFGIRRVKLGPGNSGAHVLTADAPVGIQVMGYGSYTSYHYPGGLNLDTIAPPPPPPQ